MYITHLTTAIVKALADTFDADYLESDFRNLNVSIEYPIQRENYPGLWVDWEPSGTLSNVGVGHYEIGDPHDAGGPAKLFKRWKFAGTATITVVALTSLERARLFDEVIRVLAFGDEDPSTANFRAYLEDNPLLDIQGNFDEIGQSGFAAAQGTPWGTEEPIYEGTARLECIGEFTSDGIGNLVELSAIEVISFTDVDPTSPGGWQ